MTTAPVTHALDRAEVLLRHRAAGPIVVVLSFIVLATGLGNAAGVTFDEYYYVPEARDWLEVGAPTTFTYHPPLAKYLIALGIAVAGDAPAGWRIASVTVGALAVGGTFWLGRRLLGSGLAGLLTAALLLTDGLFHGMARTGMLDVFSLGWFVAGAIAFAAGREVDEPAARRRLLLAVGAGAGLAMATKWATLPLVALPAVLWIAWERRDARTQTPPPTPLRTRWLGAALALAAMTYLAAWAPWVAGYDHTEQATVDCVAADRAAACPTGVTQAMAGLGRLHVRMLAGVSDQRLEHGQRSVPWTWPVGWRPITLFEDTCRQPILDPAHCVAEDADQHRAATIPNPVAWGAFLLATPAMFAAAARRRAIDVGAVVAVGGWAVVHLPLLVVDRVAFLTWMTPAVPFLALGGAWALTHRPGDVLGPALRALPWALGGGLVGLLLPERIPHQPAFLMWSGWLLGGLVWALTSRHATATPARDDRPVAVATALVITAVWFIGLAPVLRAAPLPPDDWRVRVVDRILLDG